MIRYAMVKSDGVVSHIISPAVDTMYTDGQVYGDHTARALPENMNGADIVGNLMWDNGWTERPPQPSFYHKWENGQWVNHPEVFWGMTRNQRDILLASSDWTQMPDAPLTSDQKTAWISYRQELRDFPATSSSATSDEELVWPTPPS